MQQTICTADCIQSVGGAIDSTAAQYTITAHVKLYDAVQSARLTVVLQKKCADLGRNLGRCFRLQRGRRGQRSPCARNASFVWRIPRKDHRRCIRCRRGAGRHLHGVYSGAHCFLTQAFPKKARRSKRSALPFLLRLPPKPLLPDKIRTKRYVSTASCAHFPMDK